MGSSHCLMMCGGVALACHKMQATRGTILYHFGRALSYSMLGCLAGLGGGAFQKISPWLFVVTACGLLCYGLVALSGVHAGFIRKIFSSKVAKFLRAYGSRGPFMLGLISAVFPCGWLYSFVAVAAVVGDPLQGAAMMFVFWIGTVAWMVVPTAVLGSVRSLFLWQRVVPLLIVISAAILLAERVPLLWSDQGSDGNFACHAG